MNKNAKILVLILSLALTISAFFAVTATAAEDNTPSIEIVSKNLSYEDNIRILFAVKSANVGDADVTLKVYETDPQDNPAAAVKETVAAAYSESINSYGECDVFFTTGIPAKFLSTQLYVQAEVTVNGVTYKSAVARYSIVEYCHEMIAKESTNAAKDAKYMDVIEYGAAIQSFLADDGKYNGALATDYKYVTINGGTLDGRYNAGIYLAGAKVNPQAAGVANWESNDGTIVANGAEYTIGTNNVSFTRPVVKVNFEGLTSLPSTITALDKGDSTIPSIRNQTANPGDRLAPVVGKFSRYSSYNSTDMLYFSYINDGPKSAVLKITETDTAAADANALEFEADIILNCAGTSNTGKEFMNFVLTNANGDVAYNLIFQNKTTIGTGSPAALNFNTRVANGASHGTVYNVVSSNDRVMTFKLRILYTNTEDSVAIKVYVDNNLVATHTQEYGINNGGNWESNIINATDIANAYFYLNTNTSSDARLVMDFAIDNLKFNKINVD